ncbi:hypothetical protein [Bartonella apis]|uniref:hypothetical protein n=1 Tax=Bartonella apis TaxID=1686310 RepID=UPI0026F2938E|nr:hypothetical protein [Bartonella apis]
MEIAWPFVFLNARFNTGKEKCLKLFIHSQAQLWRSNQKKNLKGKAKTIRHGKIIAPLSPAERPSTSAFFFTKRAMKA